jgi:DnaK suppressor protein
MAVRSRRGRGNVEEFGQRLDQMRRGIARTAATTEEELASLEPPRVGDFEDSATTDLAADVLSRLDGRARHELDEIEAARARLATGAFGICETCRGAIPLRRLRAMPTARHCLACQSRREQGNGA